MHTKHRMAKILLIILVFVMLMIYSVGCVKKESALKKDWMVMEFALPENWDDGPVRRYEDGQLTVLGSHPSDGKVCLFTLTEDGGILERRNLPAADRLKSFHWEEKGFYGIRRSDGAHVFERYDDEGQLVESVLLDGLTRTEKFSPFEVWQSSDGTRTVLSRNTVAVVSPDGTVTAIEVGARFQFLRLFPAPDGEVWVWERTERGYAIARIDVGQTRLSDLVFLPKDPEELEQPLAMSDLDVLGFDAQGRFLWAEKDGINAILFSEDGVKQERVITYEDEGLDLTKHSAALLPDGKTLVYRCRTVAHPEETEQRDGESDEAYNARILEAAWMTRFVVLCQEE